MILGKCGVDASFNMTTKLTDFTDWHRPEGPSIFNMAYQSLLQYIDFLPLLAYLERKRTDWCTLQEKKEVLNAK